jgi:ABC-2 type transport system ATP-binding protein
VGPVTDVVVAPSRVPARIWALPREMPALVLDRVSVAYPGGLGRPAVDELSLEVERAQVYGIVGPNGAGKTTTISMITGQLAPAAGSILVLGRDRGRARERNAIRRSIGVVQQRNGLYGELTALNNLQFHAALYGMPRRQQAGRIAAVLELVGLADRAGDRVKTFSGGMQRRLEIARALLHDPDLLILDEPTTGVDPHSKAAIWTYVQALKNQGKTIIVTTNVLAEADDCDQVAIINEGRLLVVDTPSELRRQHGEIRITVRMRATPFTAETVAVRMRRLAGITSVSVASAPGGWCEMAATRRGGGRLDGVFACFPPDVHVDDLTVAEANLEQVFLSLTGPGLRD